MTSIFTSLDLILGSNIVSTTIFDELDEKMTLMDVVNMIKHETDINNFKENMKLDDQDSSIILNLAGVYVYGNKKNQDTVIRQLKDIIGFLFNEDKILKIVNPDALKINLGGKMAKVIITSKKSSKRFEENNIKVSFQ